jgi:hypothetical protein
MCRLVPRVGWKLRCFLTHKRPPKERHSCYSRGSGLLEIDGDPPHKTPDTIDPHILLWV